MESGNRMTKELQEYVFNDDFSDFPCDNFEQDGGISPVKMLNVHATDDHIVQSNKKRTKLNYNPDFVKKSKTEENKEGENVGEKEKEKEKEKKKKTETEKEKEKENEKEKEKERDRAAVVAAAFPSTAASSKKLQPEHIVLSLEASDIRRTLGAKFISTFNTGDCDVVKQFVSQYCEPSLTTIWKYHGTAACHGPSHLQLIGVDALTVYMTTLFDSYPDLVTECRSNIVTLASNGRSQITCDFVFTGTKILTMEGIDCHKKTKLSIVKSTKSAATHSDNGTTSGEGSSPSDDGSAGSQFYAASTTVGSADVSSKKASESKLIEAHDTFHTKTLAQSVPVTSFCSMTLSLKTNLKINKIQTIYSYLAADENAKKM